MSVAQIVTQVAPGWWKGVRVIQIKAIPTVMQSSLYDDILARCQDKQIAAELCAFSSEGSSALTVLLILRARGGIPGDVRARLEALGPMIQRILKDANLVAESVELTGSDEPLPAWLCVQRKGRPAGYGPAESKPDELNQYIPGQYGSSMEGGIDLARLSNIVARYPCSMISVHWQPTLIFPAEMEIIDRNLQWYEGRKVKDAPGARVYSALREMKDSSAVFVSMVAWGSVEFLQDFGVQAQGFHLRSYPFPDNPAVRSNYLMRADENAAAATAMLGHDAHWRNKLPPLAQRFTHLIPVKARAFRFPQRAEEVRGIQINRAAVSHEPLPAEFSRQDGILLGEHGDTKQSIYIDPSELTRHGFFVGKSGSGKTVFALGLLHRLYTHKNRYPFLAIEPAKTEYRSLMEQIPDLRVYTPGRQDVAPMQLNPFLPPRGVRLEQYQQNLETIFAMAISMTHPLDIIFPQVIARTYAHYGWRPNSTRDSEGVRIFGMHEFIREFREYTKEHYGSDPESQHNIENGGVVRLMALMDNPIFDTNNIVDMEEMLTHPTVVELDALNNGRHKALVMGILLVQMMLAIQQRPESGSELRNLILVDEAHLLLGSGQESRENSPNPERNVVELLQNMTLILRAYGTGLMFGDQSPAKLTTTIMDNVNLKMMFHLDSLDDRAILTKSAMMSSDMSESLVSMRSGEGYMYCNTLHVPAHIVTPNAEKLLNLNKALPDELVRERMRVEIAAPFSQCAACGCCGGICDDNIRSDARFLAGRLMDDRRVQSCLAEGENQHDLIRFIQEELDRAVRENMERFRMTTDNEARMIGCVKGQFIRALLISGHCTLSEEALLGEGPSVRAEGGAPRSDADLLDFCKSGN